MRLLIVCLWLGTSISIFAQDGDEVISFHLENYGQDMWEQIQTLQISGKHVTGDYEAFPINLFIKENNQVRVEGLHPNRGYIMVLDHEVFWSAGEERPYLSLEKQILNHAVTIGSPIAKFQEQLTFQGLVAFQGSTFHSFIRKSDQLEVNYLIDKENHELRYITLISSGFEPIMATLSFDKYKSHQGLLTPTAITVKIEDQFREWVFDEILLGIAIDNKIFEKPNSQ